MQLKTYLVKFRQADGFTTTIEIKSTDQFSAKRLMKAQYGNVTIWRVNEVNAPRKEREVSRSANGDNDDGLFNLISLISCLPLIIVVAIPPYILYGKLVAQETHTGIVLVSVLGALLGLGTILVILFRVVPQIALILLGFVFYGIIGFAIGADHIWSAIIGLALGIIGATTFYCLGQNVKLDDWGD